MPTTTEIQRTTREEQLAARRRRRHEARAGATYQAFLKHASEELGVDQGACECILVAVISALEQRLPFDEMEDLASQLPYNLRELLASCLEPTPAIAPRDIGQAEFIAMVARALNVGPEEAEAHVRAVFRLLAQTVSRGEIEDVIHLLPKGLRQLWPALDAVSTRA